jgi:hypothetical protein
VRAETRRGATWFELSHDRLIDPIRKDNAAWREATLSPPQRWPTVDKQSRLMGCSQPGVADAERWAEAHTDEITLIEQTAACRKARRPTRGRNNRLIRGLAVAALIGLVLSIMGVPHQQAQRR